MIWSSLNIGEGGVLTPSFLVRPKTSNNATLNLQFLLPKRTPSVASKMTLNTVTSDALIINI